MWLRDQVFQPCQSVALHADRFQAQLGPTLVQQAQHGSLTMGAGQCGDANVYGTGANAQADPAILGQSLFCDVQLRHDLQARDQCRMQRTVGLNHLAQTAIYPESNR